MEPEGDFSSWHQSKGYNSGVCECWDRKKTQSSCSNHNSKKYTETQAAPVSLHCFTIIGHFPPIKISASIQKAWSLSKPECACLFQHRVDNVGCGRFRGNQEDMYHHCHVTGSDQRTLHVLCLLFIKHCSSYTKSRHG